MSLADLQAVLDRAAAEDWNPRLDDAAAVLATDPEGFSTAEVAGRPAAAIAVVNHDADQPSSGFTSAGRSFAGRASALRWR